MAAETSQPKSGLILQIAAVTVVLLFGVRFALVSYFNDQYDAEYTRKIGGKQSEQLVKLRAAEQKALTGGPMPIDKAMALVARTPREELGEKIAPKPSDDLAPMAGWGQMPKAVPVAVAPVPAPATTLADGGALADGAAATAAAVPGGPDAAAPKAGDAGATAPTVKSTIAAPADAGSPKK